MYLLWNVLLEEKKTKKKRIDDNIKMVVRKAGCEGGRWIELAQNVIQMCLLLVS